MCVSYNRYTYLGLCSQWHYKNYNHSEQRKCRIPSQLIGHFFT